MSRPLASLACLAVAACGGSESKVAAAPGGEVAKSVLAVLEACTAQAPEGRAIAEAGLAAAGWQPVERYVGIKGEKRMGDPKAAARLAPDEGEYSTWTRPGLAGKLDLSRFADNFDMRGTCSLWLKPAEGKSGREAVRQAVMQRMARQPDRAGSVPAGGDFLTPRKIDERSARYWQLPQHDFYLEEFASDTVLARVVAMPDRQTLDPYSVDSPRHHIYVEGEK